MSLDLSQISSHSNMAMSGVGPSCVSMRSLQHIAIWEKSARICSKYHPGRPPCFFPAHFSTHTIPQALRSLPLFVQQCPSRKLYRQFTKALLKRTSEKLCHDETMDDNSMLFLSSPCPSGYREAMCQPQFFPQTPLSSIYSLNRLYWSIKLTAAPMLNYSIWSESSHVCKEAAKRVCASESSKDGAEVPAIPLTILSVLKPPKSSRDYLALNINQQSWECADYALIRRFTVEIKSLSALVKEDMEGEKNVF